MKAVWPGLSPTGPCANANGLLPGACSLSLWAGTARGHPGKGEARLLSPSHEMHSYSHPQTFTIRPAVLQNPVPA